MGKKKVIILVGILSIFLMSFLVSSANQTKIYDSENNTILVKNHKGENLAKYKLTSNSDQCLVNCFFELDVQVFSKQKILDKINFNDKKLKLKNNQDYDVYILNTFNFSIFTNNYEKGCYYIPNINGTSEVCNDNLISVDEKIKTKSEWNLFDFKKLDVGNYTLRVEAKKQAMEELDWIIEALGTNFTEWEWWNSDWKNKKQINITDFSGGNLTNYSVKLNITYNTKMSSNFSDLRFLNGSENSELDYWIEEKFDSNHTIIWVKVPYIQASGNSSIYMYYNNSAVETTSNIENAFLMGDDFNNLNNWQVTGGFYSNDTSLVTTISANDLISHKTFNTTLSNLSMISKYLGYTLTDRFRITLHNETDQDDGSSQTGYVHSDSTTGEVPNSLIGNTGVTPNVLDGNWHTDQLDFNFIDSLNQNYTAYTDGGFIVDYNGSHSRTIYLNQNGVKIPVIAGAGANVSYDWFVVRNFVEYEPIYSIEAEQIIDTTAPNITINSINSSTSQTIIFNSTEQDDELKACWYSIFNSSGGIDGTNSNVSYICGVSKNHLATTTGIGMFNLTIYANDSANNQNSSTLSFNVSTPTIVVSGGAGGGGSTEVEKIPVVGLVNINGSKSYSDFDREVIYAKINDKCSEVKTKEPLAIQDFSKTCSLNINHMSDIVNTLDDLGIETNTEDLILFFEKYKDRQFFQGFETKTSIIEYGLFSSVLGITNPLTITPGSLRKPFIGFHEGGAFKLTHDFLVNKPIKECFVIESDATLICNLTSENTFKIIMTITDTESFDKIYLGKISITSLAEQSKTEIREVPLALTVYNLSGKIFGITAWLFIVGGILIVSVIAGMVIVVANENLKVTIVNKFKRFK